MMKKGFTLIEMMLSLALIGLVIGISAPILMNISVKQDARIEGDHLVSLIRRAHILSKTQYQNDVWSVYVDQEQAVLYKGVDFQNRDQDHDEIISLDVVNITGGEQSILFDSLSGFVQQNYTLVFDEPDQSQMTIEIYEPATITIQ